METNNKTDRFIAKNRAVELLKNGGDLLIYPEGAWNITENLPVMKLYTGTIKMAMETNAEIIPIAIEQYDDTFYVYDGVEICLSSLSNLTYSLYKSSHRPNLWLVGALYFCVSSTSR